MPNYYRNLQLPESTENEIRLLARFISAIYGITTGELIKRALLSYAVTIKLWDRIRELCPESYENYVNEGVDKPMIVHALKRLSEVAQHKPSNETREWRKVNGGVKPEIPADL